jgi:hypothetical protein
MFPYKMGVLNVQRCKGVKLQISHKNKQQRNQKNE